LSAVVAVVGATCTGKTRLAVELALRMAPASIVNADSRQVRAGLAVGTCAASAAELRGVTCHLQRFVPVGGGFTVADWLAAARPLIRQLAEQGETVVLAGGTGLYVRALLEGYRLAAPPVAERRAALEAVAASPGGLERLGATLAERNPSVAERIDLRNPRRVIRALEALDGDGPGHGTAAEATPIPATVVALDADRELHRRWVRARAERMVLSGALVEETRTALGAGIDRAALERCGIGYREALAMLEGRLTPEDAVDAVERRTLRYAKAQRTFFRALPGVYWLDASDPLADQAARVRSLIPY
jgi:tRNA dimethylallyltransferase